MRLQEILHNLVYTGTAVDADIADIVYDSRRARAHTLFTALSGSAFDGHDFVQNAYDAGSRVFLVERAVTLPADACVLLCANTRAALAHVSRNFFGNPARELRVVGVTGTKGKTTVTHMLRAVLESCGIPGGVIGTIGAYWGAHREETRNTTPESYETQRLLRRMADDGCRAVFIEVSSLGLKQHRADGIDFDTAVFTNLSPDHIGGIEHTDFAEYAHWKKQLFHRCRRCVLNADDPFSAALLREITCPAVRFGIDSPADFRAEALSFVREGCLGMSFRLRHNGGTQDCTVGMPGVFSVYNALTAIAVADSFGIPVETTKQALLHVRVRGRMESVPTPGNCSVLIDYAHNGLSFKNVLETVRAYPHKRLLAVFGCVGGRAQVRREEMALIAGSMCDLTVITTDDPQYEDPAAIAREVAGYLEKTGGRYVVRIDRREAIFYALAQAQEGDIVLLLGKGHEEYMAVRGEKLPFSERETVAEYYANTGERQ